MKKRIIKKKVKSMNDKDLCEHVAYGSGFWGYFAEIEFGRRLMNDWFLIKRQKFE